MLQTNKVYLGDCLNLMKKIEDKSIDLILCDLPYGTTSCKWDIIIPLNDLWDSYERIIKDDGSIVLTATQPFASKLINSNIDLYKYSWYYEKSKAANYVNCNYQPLRIIEEALVFSKAASTFCKNGIYMKYNPQKIIHTKPRKRSNINFNQKSIIARFKNHEEYQEKTNNEVRDSFPKNLIYAHTDADDRIHPTQKPIALFEYLIKTYTNKGDIVLDNCAGSGTTGIACLNLDRKFILMEKEEEYYEKILTRIENHCIRNKKRKKLENFYR